jgi:hypothetical protein
MSKFTQNLVNPKVNEDAFPSSVFLGTIQEKKL